MKHIIKAGLTAGWDIIFSYFAWMLRYSKHPERTPIEKRYKKVQRLTKHVFKKLNSDFIVNGLENIPEETSCFFPNHLSMLDPVLIVSVLDKPISFVAKRETETLPFAGKIIKSIDGEFMDRDDLKQSLKVMQRVQKELENKAKHWCIFPEGTRNKDANSLGQDFHYGSFKPAMRARVPIVPVAIYGTFRVLKKKPEFKRYPVQISFLKPIMPEEYEKMTTQEVAKLVASRVRAEIIFKLRPLDHELMYGQKIKGYSPYHIY